MARFTATIETDWLEFEVVADLYEDGLVDIARIKMAGEPLLLVHEKYFIEQYYEDALKEEVRNQYDAWCKNQAEDKMVENYEINKSLDENGWR